MILLMYLQALNEYRLAEQENYLLVDGIHEGIISEELWNAT